MHLYLIDGGTLSGHYKDPDELLRAVEAYEVESGAVRVYDGAGNRYPLRLVRGAPSLLDRFFSRAGSLQLQLDLLHPMPDEAGLRDALLSSVLARESEAWAEANAKPLPTDALLALTLRLLGYPET